MSEYIAPLRDMRFALQELIDIQSLLSLPGYEDLEPDLLFSVLEQAAKFATEVLSPLNRVGDEIGSQLESGTVVTPPGWREAYQSFIRDGWNGVASTAQWGGQGLPAVVAALTDEMWYAANVSFGLGPMLTHSAIDALQLAASDTIKAIYLPKLVSGQWMGTMNLTEPQAGSDLAAVKTRALPQADGTYRIHGQKIFITYGDHDLTENIVHLVLARIPDGPAGVKGLSLFVVPKVLVNADGMLGERNALRCISLEHKLGIHASPTCVMQFGGEDMASGAVGWLVGEENRGLEYMFIMMNAARFSVGVQGIGLAERAYQRALQYARERKQGAGPTSKSGAVTIVHHPDVRRMLLTMKSTIEAMRALECVVAAASDRARLHLDTAVRAQTQARVALLTPVVKGWCTESAVHLSSLGLQVHGGMGYVEETGAAQYFRDARITTIYEGTTGIQANDLVGRKIVRDGGETAHVLITEIAQDCTSLSKADDPQLRAIAARLQGGIHALTAATQFTASTGRVDLSRALAGAAPLLRLFGVVCGGWQLGRAAFAAHRLLQERREDQALLRAKLATAQFYADNILSDAASLAHAVIDGGDVIMALEPDQF